MKIIKTLAELKMELNELNESVDKVSFAVKGDVVVASETSERTYQLKINTSHSTCLLEEYDTYEELLESVTEIYFG